MSCTTPRDGVPRFTLRPAATSRGPRHRSAGPTRGGRDRFPVSEIPFPPVFPRPDRRRWPLPHRKNLERPRGPSRQTRLGQIRGGRAPPAPDGGPARGRLYQSGKRSRFDLAAVPGTEVVGRVLDPAHAAPVVGAGVARGLAQRAGRRVRHRRGRHIHGGSCRGRFPSSSGAAARHATWWTASVRIPELCRCTRAGSDSRSNCSRRDRSAGSGRCAGG